MRNRKPHSPNKKNQVSLAISVIAGAAIFMSGLGLAADDAEARRKRSRPQKVSIVKKPKRPLVLVVSLRRQKVTVFDGADVVRRAPISSGSAGRRTPMGIFSVIQKHRQHYSNLYNSASMPFMQRITWSGIALHEGRLPGYPASHGCIRLPGGFARGLFKMTSMGTRIIVTRDMLSPRIYSHDALFKPLPFDEPPPPVAANQVAPVAANQAPPVAAIKVAPAAVDQVATTPNPAVGGSPPATGGAMSISAVVGLSQARAAADPTNAGPATVDGAKSSKMVLSNAKIQPLAEAAPRLTRAQLKAARAAKMLQLTSSITETKDLLKVARDKVMQERLHLRQAGKTATIAKQHLRRLKRHEAKARRLTRNAASQVISFERRYSNRTFYAVADADLLAKAMNREDALEENYFAQSEEADVARIDVSDMQIRLSLTVQQVQQAKDDLAAAQLDAKAKRTRYNLARSDLKKAKRAEKLRKKPIAIFISRRTGKLYIRQGYKPIYQTPVSILNPDQPLGTHVFTALQFNKSKTGLAWSVVSVEDAGPRSRRSARRGRRISYPRARPDSILERIAIPEDARYLIAQLIKPGSSLIISDRRQSNETGKYTDFIVSLN